MSEGYLKVGGGGGSGKSLPTSAKTVAERLAFILEALGEDESVRATGLSWKTLKRYAAGSDPSMTAVIALSEAAAVPLEWVALGRELPGGDVAGRTLDSAAHPGEFALLPRYSVAASAGQGLLAQEEFEVERIAFRLDWLREIGLDPKQAGLLTAQGDSMHPTIPDGALMLVDRRENQPIRSGYIYVIVLDGEVLVKRLSRNTDKTIDLISDNPLYPVKNIPQTEFDGLFIAGRVFWVGRKL